MNKKMKKRISKETFSNFILSDKKISKRRCLAANQFQVNRIELNNGNFLLIDDLDRAKEQTRELRRTDRELVRDRHKLEAEEQKLINEIRKNAASGNKKVTNE